PPLRAHLYGLSAREHVLLLVLHHIAGDGWSLGVLLRDIARCYGARRAGEAPGLAPLAVQYADYTLWQQEVLGRESEEGSALSRQLAFWREHLEGLPEQIELPSDRARPAVARHRGGSVGLSLDGELHAGLLRLWGSGGGAACWAFASCAFWGSQPVHGVAGWIGWAAEPAGRGQRHRAGEPDCGAHGQRAGRSGGVLCEHAGAADGRVRGAEHARVGWAGAYGQSAGLQPSGGSV